MDVFDSHETGGRLQISTDVIEKIARLAAMEVEGVVEVRPASTATKPLKNKLYLPKAIRVELKNGVADLEISLVVAHGTKIPELCERVQKNAKDSVQSMTSISVARVDVIVVGMVAEQPA